MIRLDGLAAELCDEIAKLPVVDCHEHLPPEESYLSEPKDVTSLFQHYCLADLQAAGLTHTRVFDHHRPLMSRWRELKPYLEAIRYGSYAYPAFAYVRDVLGFEDITDDTVEAISERMRQGLKPGHYKRTIQDLCGIKTCIICDGDLGRADQPFFVYLMRDRVHSLCEPAGIVQLERASGVTIHSLQEAEAAVSRHIERQVEKGAVGYKIGAAYQRKIEFAEVSRSEAEGAFRRLRRAVRPQVSEEDRLLLEDYLIRRAVEGCIEHAIPVVIHTGFQAGTGNDIRNARATHLWHLLKSYPEARFDLFHGSFPYVEDMTVLGKYFGNTSLNMCWMHIMGPAVSRRALDQWLDAVPVTKIFAFGGDYRTVENIYGHLDLARADVAAVLAEKVKLGRMTEQQALDAARLLFYENPVRWYNL